VQKLSFSIGKHRNFATRREGRTISLSKACKGCDRSSFGPFCRVLVLEVPNGLDQISIIIDVWESFYILSLRYILYSISEDTLSSIQRLQVSHADATWHLLTLLALRCTNYPLLRRKLYVVANHPP
jgi:hypothetical protein